MRPHFPRPFAARQPAAAAERAGSERSVAEALLGAGHPLVRLLRRFETTFEQLVSGTAVQAAGLTFFLGGFDFGLFLAMAAAAVQVALACRVVSLRASRHDLCRQLIVEGGAKLPLPCVERVGRGLLDHRKLEQLARSVDELVATAARRRGRPAAPPPLAEARVIRAVSPELREVASLLRGGAPAVRGVALIEWLITSAATPLYGTEVEPLQRELGRARYLLTAYSRSDRS